MARKILLADDSVTAQNMGRKILADAGYEVTTVNNGSAALKKIGELKPDLVILDVYMPGYSGLEVCQRLKESQDSARIPVLLTVGKLEPFKPEESHRVRADGFIVKPFEASELLSALSKLEDKVVPRAEASKSGRFARAIAATEETGRGGRSEATSEDDGWRSRIGFPQKKKEPEPEEKAAEPIYNPMNRDLRTVVETSAEMAAEKAAEKQEEEKRKPSETAPEASVDVAALAPAGLPRDVTPEEIAALAAAAAQIQMSGAAKREDSHPTHASPISKSPVPELSPAPVEPVAEPAQLRAEEQIPIQANVPIRDNIPPESVSSVSPETHAEPVTMAAVPESMAAESRAAESTSAPRWTAVSVALEGEESSISLDQEMRKACAGFVAEEKTVEVVAPMPQAEIAPPNSSAHAEAEAPAAIISNPQPESLPQAEQTASPEIPAPAPTPISQTENAAVASFAPAESASLSEPARPSIPQPDAASSAPAPSDAAPVEPTAEASTEVKPVQLHPEPVAECVSEPIAANMESTGVQQSEPTPVIEPGRAESASSPAFEPSVHTEERQNFEYRNPEYQSHELRDESEAVKNTAAAWANWRQTHDTDAKNATSDPGRQEPDAPSTAEPAAMAVAAGAEQAEPIAQAPPVPSPENPGDVASIVDSVLADLRPRLMAEITRKMSEKK